MIDITTLRPKGNSASDLNEALAQARMASEQLQNHAAETKRRRDELILVGDAKALAAAGKAITEARETAEMIEVLVVQLEKRLADETRREMLESLASLKARVEAARNERANWWTSEGPRIKAVVQKGKELDLAAHFIYHEWVRARLNIVNRYPDVRADNPTSPPSSNESDALSMSLLQLDTDVSWI